MDPDKYICKIAFDLNVEGLIQSEIMQIFNSDTVEEIVALMMGDTNSMPVQESFKSEPTPDVLIREPEIHIPDPIIKTPTEKVTVQKPLFSTLTPDKDEKRTPRNLDLIMDVPLEFSVVLGKSRKTIKEVLSFGNGSVIELNKLADEPLEIYVNGKLIAQGEVVVINENFGIRITNILSKEQRVQNLK